jgi:plasmid stabilization system protein ParE
LNGALIWTQAAASDLRRLHYFLSVVNDSAATRAVRLIVSRARRIPENPGLGSRIARYGRHEVRRIVVGQYEIRYAVRDRDIAILRVFHHRERR